MVKENGVEVKLEMFENFSKEGMKYRVDIKVLKRLVKEMDLKKDMRFRDMLVDKCLV